MTLRKNAEKNDLPGDIERAEKMTAKMRIHLTNLHVGNDHTNIEEAEAEALRERNLDATGTGSEKGEGI